MSSTVDEKLNSIINSLLLITNEINSITEQNANMSVNINSIFARIDVLEKCPASSNISTKRAIKLLSDKDQSVLQDKKVKAPESVSSSSNTTPIKEKGIQKITNTLSFFKIIIMNDDYNDLRKNYESMIPLVKIPEKKPIGSKCYWADIAGSIWADVLDDSQKKILIAEFKKWKSENEIIKQTHLTKDDDCIDDE